MAAKRQQPAFAQSSSDYKKSKFTSSTLNKGSKKPFKKANLKKLESHREPQTKQECRLHAKELTEARKKKRKRHYDLEQELASLWEKMRGRNIDFAEDRSKLITDALQKMKGKIPEIAGSHVSSRVLQTCVKYCSQSERDTVFEELQPHFLTLAENTYAVHLVKKMLDNASKKQLTRFISVLRGHVAFLLRHMVGSVVVEHAYQLGNAPQKQELLIELYSTELQLFKDLVSVKESRLVDIILKLTLHKASVSRHIASVIQPILEKGIVDHSIIHKVLMEYFSIADKSSAIDVIQQLSGPLLVHMIHTRDGSKIGMLCVKHGSAKERKKIIKGMKEHIGKTTHDQCGSMIIVRELQAILKEVLLDKNGRRVLLQLLHPNCQRYISPDDLTSLDSSIPSLVAKNDSSDKNADLEELVQADESADPGENLQLVEGGKKDPYVRRQELLVSSGLAESLIGVCLENAGELLRSNFGKEVLYEVARGGSDNILSPTLDEKLNTLHEAVASLAAKSKSEALEEEHILENFHSSRTIRKLIMDCPSFASTLWKKALSGNCKLWAKGHSSKVIFAFLESSDCTIRDLAEKELQPLIDEGILKTHY